MKFVPAIIASFWSANVTFSSSRQGKHKKFKAFTEKNLEMENVTFALRKDAMIAGTNFIDAEWRKLILMESNDSQKNVLRYTIDKDTVCKRESL